MRPNGRTARSTGMSPKRALVRCGVTGGLGGELPFAAAVVDLTRFLETGDGHARSICQVAHGVGAGFAFDNVFGVRSNFD